MGNSYVFLGRPKSMGSETDVHRIPARREAVRGGGTVLGGGVLAGRAGGSAGSTRADTTDATTSSQSTAADSTPYEVTIEPAGSHTFEETPETCASIPGAWMDVAMGFGIQPTAVAALDRLPLNCYDALPGVDSAFAGEECVPFEPIGSAELLEVDPDDVGAIDSLSCVDDARSGAVTGAARSHGTLGRPSAVENGEVGRTDGQYTGPIVDPFSAEALAERPSPDGYGEWPGSVGDVPEDERPFDRGRVADVVEGAV